MAIYFIFKYSWVHVATIKNQKNSWAHGRKKAETPQTNRQTNFFLKIELSEANIEAVRGC